MEMNFWICRHCPTECHLYMECGDDDVEPLVCPMEGVAEWQKA